MQEKALGNPAVVGLAGFGGTTFLLQLYNLGILDVGPVFWSAMFFGGLAQLIAGGQEFRTGNNFGLAAFSTYGVFWLALGGIFIGKSYNVFNVGTSDIGWFLVMFTILTFIFFVGAMKQTGALAFLFFTLLLGFIFLDVSHLGGPAVFTTIAAVDLIICAFTAFYLMAHVVLGQQKINLPVGSAWIK